MHPLRHIAICIAAFCAIVAAARPSDPIVGQWRFTSGGAEIEIAEDSIRDGHYTLRYLDGPDMSIAPGRTIGRLHATPVPGRYIGRMALDPSRTRSKHRDVVVKLTDRGSLTFEPYRAGMRISFWRWIPYLFRVTVIEPGQHPSETEGAVRLDRPDFVRHRVL